MKKRVFAAVLSCCMLLTVCSGCGKKTIRRNEGTLNESVTSMLDKAAENTASSPAAETVDRTAKFQAVMDAVSVDSRYASCKRYVMVNDYDGDGKQEAFGILAGDQTDWGFSDWARIYYISSDGFIFCAQSSRADGTQLYGYLPGSDGYAADPQSCLLTAGNQKFLRWELSAGGSGSVTSILGVKDGAPYHPQISEMYQDVRQQGGKYYAVPPRTSPETSTIISTTSWSLTRRRASSARNKAFQREDAPSRASSLFYCPSHGGAVP